MSKLKTAAHKTIKWYDNNAASYAEKTLKRARNDQIESFVDLLPEHPMVLDVGCGPGRDTAILNSKGCKVIGLDLSSGLVEEAKRRYPTIDFVIGDMTKLPFEDNFLDGIWANASLLHLPTADDVKKTLDEFVRVLKVNGVVHISVKAQTSEAETAVVKDDLSGAERFFRYFKIDDLTELIEQAGFEVITAQQLNESEQNLEIARPEVDWIVVRAKKRVKDRD
jgi:ubiquinone/menaquinone biosynthesis C-methylase UbiE